MLFTSLEFLFLFLPLVLGVYYCLNDRAKNVWLLVASLAFYAWGEPKFVVVMIGSIVFNYIMAIFIAVFRVHTWVTAVFLGFAVIGNLSVLFVYKYANFVNSIARDAFPCWTGIVPQTSFVLPIGISFFTFQALSYVIDYALWRMVRHHNYRSQRRYRLKFADTHYGELNHYGMYWLKWADVRR